MGLFDKFASAFSGPAVDHAAEIAAAGGDAALATARVVPSAYTRGGGGGVSLDGKLLNAALSAVQNTASGSKHLGGVEGSTAHQLSRASDVMVLSLGEDALTWWDFGMTANSVPPELTQRVDRTQVASIVDTGTKAQGGVPVVRFTFADGSWADYRVMQPSETFWSVAAAYGRA
ncbi:hypothetical protein IT072_11140 [Leifsonia sp. ZF2019]|uniref:hypothetical protein n=1 Tax=Leifsonia sp. ZF2019 TaxID=2781978 RepID=UPI001CBCD9C2|nr:hypothetical protein [Leifsonia sp. ZF2019]UAJ77856.1 hypothetical protein IT072_11140 [Leifsonia sp. ZF2019]